MQKESPENILIRDGVGVIPTDTLYGIVGSALSKKAVARIYAAKGRDESKPFIVLISQISDLALFGIKLTLGQAEFLTSAWPGPVSVIIPCPLKKFEYLHRGTNSIAFRMPKNTAIHDLLKQTGPLVAPSANPQGKEPAHTIAEAKAYFKDAVDFYLPGGTKNAKPSTIVSLVSGIPVILRK